MEFEITYTSCTRRRRVPLIKEIKTLEELINFAEEQGDLIIKPNKRPVEIEVYDDYRE